MRTRRPRHAGVAVAVLGGAALGYGIGRLAFGFTLGASVWTVLGALLLWWAFAERFRARRGAPERDDADSGGPTVE